MNITRRFAYAGRALLSCVAIAASTFNAEAATTDLATVPLVSSSSTAVLPNVFLMMDDSGSMDWDFMPDIGNSPPFSTSTYGYASNQCNGVFYDPTVTYTPPVNSTGASYANSTFTGAWMDGYNTGAGTLNLSTRFTLGLSQSSTAPGSGVAAYYYRYTGAQTTAAQKNFYDSTTTFYRECNSAIGSAPGSAVFTRVTVAAGEQQNFANWFSYYRTRINMMKTATGLAFKPIDNHYRVGFATMNNNGGNMFLNPSTFDSTQKSAWYNMVYSVSAGSSTPLLSALSNVGLMYAHKLTGNTLNGVAANDPIQYSCQQNFTILSTDGFWNDATNQTLTAGPSTTAVGNQDGGETRPMFDGGSVSTVVTATLTISGGSSSTTVDSLLVNGLQILSATTSSSSSSSGIATAIAAKINTCTAGMSGTCQIAGYSAVANSPSSGVVTITAPASLGAITYTPVPHKASGTKTITASAFASNVVSSGGTSNTLADVAEYYYMTDLRTAALTNDIGALGTDVSLNNVPTSGLDSASWQHMTLFTLGLGARGRMVFSPTYKTDTSGDYFSVKNGTTANPAGGVCSWQASGACNWPTPNVSGTPENIDDLWHAAVNGRGSYFSASSPTELATGLSTALAGVSARTGAAAAATTSNPNVTSGDNFVFSSTFNTVTWDGELIRQQLDLTTGVTSSTVDWTARDQLDLNAARTIYTFSSTAPNKLKSFLWASLSATEQAYFTSPNISSLSQFCASGATCLSAANIAAAAGSPLVSFLRGDRSNEGASTDLTKFYHQRAHVLGDIVDAEAVYVKSSLVNYGPSHSA
ncbi:MAG: hypothetical protein NT159_10505, partial [Proteobacteria bacterium]|nr:hypothetical protein [Pseudomonadota bacterium]